MNATTTSLKGRVGKATSYLAPQNSGELEQLYGSIKRILLHFLTNEQIEAKMDKIREHHRAYTTQADWVMCIAQVKGIPCPVCEHSERNMWGSTNCDACCGTMSVTALEYDELTSIVY